MRSTFLDQTPIRMGTAEEFACVARTLKDASFDEETICRTFQLARWDLSCWPNESIKISIRATDQLCIVEVRMIGNYSRYRKPKQLL